MSPCYCSCCFQQGLSGGQFLREKRQASIPRPVPVPSRASRGPTSGLKVRICSTLNPFLGLSLTIWRSNPQNRLPALWGRLAIEHGNRSLMWYAGRRKGGGKGGMKAAGSIRGQNGPRKEAAAQAKHGVSVRPPSAGVCGKNSRGSAAQRP